MKVVFWSPVKGQSGSTSNLLAISIISTIIYEQYNIIVDSSKADCTLRNALVGESKKEYFQKIGVDAVLRYMKSSALNEEKIKNCTISLLDKHLDYIPPYSVNELYEEEMTESFCSVLKIIERYQDFVFIDAGSGNSKVTKKIKESADIVIVNLPQNINVINDYFESNTEDELQCKSFYLIGNYNCNSRYNMKNLRRSYNEFNKKNTAIIPYNIEFYDSIIDGQTIDFIKKNINCSHCDKNHYFVKSCKKAANQILDFIGIKYEIEKKGELVCEY